MEPVDYIPRALEPELRRQLSRRKSVLLLGPRQTGKTTLLSRFPADFRVELLLPEVRQRYERNPGQLLGEIAALPRKGRRPQALVRNVGSFARFLELAGLESGGLVSFRALSQDLGIAHTTVASFYEILEDCLVAERVDPLARSRTRTRLTKSSRYLLFDMGVR